MYILIEKEKDMKIKIAAAAIALTMAATPASAQNDLFGDINVGNLLGAAAGGFLGSRIGGGSGKHAAIAVGTLLGSQVGGRMYGQNNHHSQPTTVPYPTYPTPPAHTYYYGTTECDQFVNPGVRSACLRGLSGRLRHVQVQAEKQAYSCARYGRCY